MSGSVFEDVTIKWGEEEYTIKASDIMGVICRIENHITFLDLQSSNPKLINMARAYGEVLRSAGAEITDEVVYSEMFKDSTMGQIQNAINGLMYIMIPPEHLQKKTPTPKHLKKVKAKKASRKSG